MATTLEQLALTLLQQLLSKADNAATANQQQQILNAVNRISTIAEETRDNTIAIAANLSDDAHSIEVMLNQVMAMIRPLTNQIGVPQQAGLPVTLPQFPPAGYGGASTSDVANAVWGYPLPNATPFTTLNSVDSMQGLAYFMSNLGHHDSIQDQPGYAMTGQWSEPRSTFSGPSNAFLDFSTILPTDATILAWANRVYPGTTWHAGLEGTAFEIDSLNAAIRWWVDLTPTQFRQLQSSGGAAVRVPPVWPGLSGVTLQATVALADGLTITHAMDGVIVAITSERSRAASYQYGSHISYTFAGALAFIDDRGELEQHQKIGWDHGVYVPRSMEHAAGVVIRTDGNAGGTVTPWSVN